jgi:hypothetical protein
MFTAVLIALLAFAFAGFTYWGLERLGRRAWLALLCRGVAWTSLGLLLLNLSCPVRGAPRRPLVLLDASLSLGAAGGLWREARDSAVRWGEVRSFGDERLTADTTPTRGRSLLAPSLLAASASDRPVLIVTDGEIEDQREIPPDILARTGVRLFPRNPRSDVAISRASAPSRVTAGDSIPIEVLVQAVAGTSLDTVSVEVLAGTTRLARRVIRLGGPAGGRARIMAPSAGLSAGDHLLRIRLTRSADAEPRTDIRLQLVTVAATPGAVFLAAPPDWDSRFLYRTLREVSQLPVRGYVRLERDRWRSMADLRPVPADQVRRAVRRADLLVLKGGVGDFARGTLARGIWRWPSGESGEPQISGDWYIRVGDASPVAGAFLGQPVDSFPPATQLTPMVAGPRDWVALYAQLGRRGPQRPVAFGGQDGRVREVTVAAEGFWRWPFRGGSSEQSYRSWVAATASWLLGGTDSAQGVARPVQPVVANGRPLVFEWVGAGPAKPVGIIWSGATSDARNRMVPRGSEIRDTLHFDGDGRATVWLAPGEYRYRLAGGGTGTVAVEQYSDELLPRPVSLTAHEARAAPPRGRTAARDWLWLFGICLLALSGEWLVRRRLGLR